MEIVFSLRFAFVRCTISETIPAVAEISSSVVYFPREKRMADRARASGSPIANRTCDATTLPTIQAEPLDAQTPLPPPSPQLRQHFLSRGVADFRARPRNELVQSEFRRAKTKGRRLWGRKICAPQNWRHRLTTPGHPEHSRGIPL